ncbi:MAG: dipicolinate synthase subunit B [Hydrogenoanaerobacterium sp.]
MLNKIKIGFALCGSFCTFGRILPEIKRLAEAGYDIYPIMSEFAFATDTRFGTALDFVKEIEAICGKKIISNINDAEPIGPAALLDALIVAPCTGNTLGKLACGITDTSVTMACKAHLRNARPLIIAVSTNDGLGASARNVGQLLNVRNVYFVPYAQDDCIKKPASLVSDFTLIEHTLEYALKNVQIQPLIR